MAYFFWIWRMRIVLGWMLLGGGQGRDGPLAEEGRLL
jgi:hypothetical protein